MDTTEYTVMRPTVDGGWLTYCSTNSLDYAKAMATKFKGKVINQRNQEVFVFDNK